MSLDIVSECAANLFEHKHFDINRKVKRTVKLKNINVAKVEAALDEAARMIETKITDNTDNSTLSAMITDEIYRCCSENRIKKQKITPVLLTNGNCNSHNYIAIANANFTQYQRLLKEGGSEDDFNKYRDTQRPLLKSARKKNLTSKSMRSGEIVRKTTERKCGQQSIGKGRVLLVKVKRSMKIQFHPTSKTYSNHPNSPHSYTQSFRRY